jgi:hypothetical protein
MTDKISKAFSFTALGCVFTLIYLHKVDIVIEFMGNAIKIISK